MTHYCFKSKVALENVFRIVVRKIFVVSHGSVFLLVYIHIFEIFMVCNLLSLFAAEDISARLASASIIDNLNDQLIVSFRLCQFLMLWQYWTNNYVFNYLHAACIHARF